ncbi:dehydrogenase/reductase SDR family member on chromosome X-like [Ylistrum balloti]|uniref:dehydrogenase/reductase SDR family member on chromosome X-like n=1 Tax=Ylistrum balloti TaxID=509963 RepID=UPI002905EAEF|nr:dehydrogenase/reductase SDR family member on chromosome X-like [Ylistrum balloti]
MGGRQSFPVVPFPRERVVIITGGNKGIGYQTAKWIAMMGATVILACRSENKAFQAIEDMNREFLEEKQKGTLGLAQYDELSVEFMKLDCASLKSVREFIDEFKATGRKLHVLICNAGINTVEKTLTEDGNELLFQVNYLSHFLMTVSLLPVMKSSGSDCRIVLLSSLWYKSGRFELNKINAEDETMATYDSDHYYQKSKLYMIMMMYKMNRILLQSDITVTCVHPGIVRTNMMDEFQEKASCMYRGAVGCINCLGLSKSVEQGSWTSVNAVVNPELTGVRDVYFNNSKPETIKPHAKVLDEQETLWQFSLDRVKNHLPDDILEELKNT